VLLAEQEVQVPVRLVVPRALHRRQLQRSAVFAFYLLRSQAWSTLRCWPAVVAVEVAEAVDRASQAVAAGPAAGFSSALLH
jgi:hypothetical protein